MHSEVDAEGVGIKQVQHQGIHSSGYSLLNAFGPMASFVPPATAGMCENRDFALVQSRAVETGCFRFAQEHFGVDACESIPFRGLFGEPQSTVYNSDVANSSFFEIQACVATSSSLLSSGNGRWQCSVAPGGF